MLSSAKQHWLGLNFANEYIGDMNCNDCYLKWPHWARVRDRYGISLISYVFSPGCPSCSYWEYTLTTGMLSFGVCPLQKQIYSFHLTVALKLLHLSLTLRIEKQPITFIFTNPWWLCYLTTYFIINSRLLKLGVLKLLFNCTHRALLVSKKWNLSQSNFNSCNREV